MKFLISKRQIWKFKKLEQEVQKSTSKIFITDFLVYKKNQRSPNLKRGAFRKEFIKTYFTLKKTNFTHF